MEGPITDREAVDRRHKKNFIQPGVEELAGAIDFWK